MPRMLNHVLGLAIAAVLAAEPCMSKDLRDLYLPFLQAPVRFGSFYLRTEQSLSELSARVREAVGRLERFAIVSDIEPVSQSDR